jgi:hypothetical protein
MRRNLPAGADHGKDQSRSTRRDDRNDSIAREPMERGIA